MSGRIRTIKPDWADDERMSRASDAARVMSVCLILFADDHGNGRAAMPDLSLRVFPVSGESPEELASAIRKGRAALAELVALGFVDLYALAGQHYYSVRNWKRHQRVDKPGKPHVPGPEMADSGDIPETVARQSGEARKTLAPDRDLDQDREGTRARAREETTPPPADSMGNPEGEPEEFSPPATRRHIRAFERGFQSTVESWSGWTPKQSKRLVACGKDPARLAEKFVASHKSSGKRSSDWEAEAETWVLSDEERAAATHKPAAATTDQLGGRSLD